jgi:hypothetical protein
VTASDIGDFGTALELFDDTVERRQPVAHQMVVVAGAEKARDRAKETARVVAPRHAGAGREHRLDLILALGHPGHQVERPHHIDGAVLDREDHRLFRRQGEILRRRVVGEIVRGCLMRQPFAHIALIDSSLGSKLVYGHRAALVQSLVEPQRIADPDQCNARRAAEIRQHLSHKLMQFRVVNHGFLPEGAARLPE